MLDQAPLDFDQLNVLSDSLSKIESSPEMLKKQPYGSNYVIPDFYNVSTIQKRPPSDVDDDELCWW